MDELDEQVRRPRSGRAALSVLAIVAMVGAVVGAAALVGHADDHAKVKGPLAAAPAVDSPATSAPTREPGDESPNEDCGHGDGLVDVFTTQPPPIPAESLAEQRRVIDRVKGRDWPGFRVIGAEATHLGVVALVDAQYDRAKEALEAEGVRLVAVKASEYGSVHEQVMGFLQELLEPAIADINRVRKSVPGFYGIAVWSEGGAVVLDWKAPIPAQVTAMAGVRDDGVNVIAQPVQYSVAEIEAAQQRVSGAFHDHRVDAKWSTETGCQDGSGLVVGIQPESLGSRQAELESQLSDIAGMPVHVVAEDAPVPADLRGTRTKG